MNAAPHGMRGAARRRVADRLERDLADLIAAVATRLGADGKTIRRPAPREALAETLVQLALDALRTSRATDPLGTNAADVGLLAAGTLDAEGVGIVFAEIGAYLHRAWQAGGDDPPLQLLIDMASDLGRLEAGVTHALARTHDSENSAANRKLRRRDAFLRRLLDRPLSNLWAAERDARALGLDLSPPLDLALFVSLQLAGHEPDEPYEALDAWSRRQRRGASVLVVPAPLDGVPDAVLRIAPGGDVSARGGTPAHYAEVCEEVGLVAVRACVPALDELHLTFERLRQALPLVATASERLGPVMSLDDLFPLLAALGLSAEEQDALLRSLVGPLLSSGSEADRHRHLSTLRAVADTLRIDRTATGRRLGIKPSTVHSRLQAIEALTGRSIEGEIVRYLLVSSLYDLWEQDLPDPDDPWWRGEG